MANGDTRHVDNGNEQASHHEEAAEKPDQKDRGWLRFELELSTRLILAFGLAAAWGFVCAACIGSSDDAGGRLLAAAAALGVGGLIGFLFGVPRSAARPEDTAGPAANTNLEQISDWLTKLLVGAGLVQISAAPAALGTLFGHVGSLFGEGMSATVAAGATLIYFACLGFLAGWLFTRIFLGRTLSEADKWMAAAMGLADIAEKEGDSDLAETLRAQAKSGPAGPGDVLEAIRTSAPPGAARTAAIDQAFDTPLSAEEMAVDRGKVEQMFTTDEPSRLAALRIMMQRPEVVSLPCVIDAIEHSTSGMEQYHALRVARAAVDRLSAEEKSVLKRVVDEASRPGRWIAQDPPRASVAKSLREALDG
jgi:hypothetical protein